MNPYQVVRDFESALCEYTGAKYAVAVTSCTMALLLACRWHDRDRVRSETHLDPFERRVITIPRRTYVGVPMSIIHAGFKVRFNNLQWSGDYVLSPIKVVDSARLMTSDMYEAGYYQCLSFHWSKHLAIGQGGAILHDNDEADEWFRKMRFDGRTEGVEPRKDNISMIGYHCYMSPRDAADGLSRLAVLPKHNAPLPNDDYPDLSKLEIFK